MTDEARAARQKESVARILALVAEEDAAEKKADNSIPDEDEVPEYLRNAAPEAHDDDDTLGKTRADQQAEEDKALARLNIVSVYKKLTGNEVKRSGGRGEKLVFCPTDTHNNSETEAACINLEKKTWVCYGQCDDGGGIIDMVAAASGMPFGKNLKGKDYAQAKQKTLEDFCGWTFDKTSAGWEGKSPERQKAEVEEFEATYGKLPDEEPDDEPVDPAPASVTSIVQRPTVVPDPKEDEDSVFGVDDDLPEIDGIFDYVPKGTALYEFLYQTRRLATPKEYLLFRGLQLLALSAGSFIRGEVAGREFKPSLSVLFVGATGVGKSDSLTAMERILEHITFKWNPSPPAGSPWGRHDTGVKVLDDPASGEALISDLSKEVDSSGNVFAIRDTLAFLEVDEFAQFMAKASQKGSILMHVFQKLENNGGLEHRIASHAVGTGHKVAYNPNVTFGAGIQPKAMPAIIGKLNVGNGFFARFELVTGNKHITRDVRETVMGNLDHARELYADVFVNYLRKVDPEDKGARNLYKLPLDENAYDLFNEINYRMQKLEKSDDIKSRFALKFRKMALLFAINSMRDSITTEDLRAAEWIMEFLDRTANLAANKTMTTEGIEVEDKIISAVLSETKSKGYATFGRVYQVIRGEKRGWEKQYVQKYIDHAIERGDILIDPRQASRGPKTTRYVVAAALSAAELKVVNQQSNTTRQGRKSK